MRKLFTAALTAAAMFAFAPLAQAAATLDLFEIEFLVTNDPTNEFLATDLTQIGELDWRDFRANGVGGDWKDGVTTRISTLSAVDGPLDHSLSTNAINSTSWTDGAVTPSVSNNREMLNMPIGQTAQNDAGYTFTVDVLAGRTESLYVYAGGWNARAMLTVTLGAETETLAFFGGNNFAVVYRIDFYSDSDDTMTVKWGFDPNFSQPDGTWSNVGIKAAALIPEPASLGLLAAGALFMLGRRRRTTVAH